MFRKQLNINIMMKIEFSLQCLLSVSFMIYIVTVKHVKTPSLDEDLIDISNIKKSYIMCLRNRRVYTHIQYVGKSSIV